jgi:starch synthase
VNVLFVSSEVAPFAKTGGLGDVGAALPRHLHELGHDVRVFVPLYQRVQAQLAPVVPEMAFAVGPHTVRASIWSAPLPRSASSSRAALPVYFVRCPSLYDRPSIYGNAPDEHLRFAVLNRAALEACRALRFSPGIAHVNDWPTAILPLLLRSGFGRDPLFARTRTVLTIHNLGHQGTFPARALAETGLEPARALLHQDDLGQGILRFLTTGILHANAITTVSPTYAREIQTPEHGVGLDGLLRSRRDVLFGILNGIDEDEWNPATDPHLPHHFSIDDLSGKARCKTALLDALGFRGQPELPLVGLVSRLVWQKGIDLCMAVLPGLLQRRAFRLVVLGNGEPRYTDFFARLAGAFPGRVSYQSGFDETRAHWIEAGCDLFLMPSRYEPCGLNQMYSLRYGTPPIVHATGGLADTVQQWDSGRGTGFVFDHFDEGGLTWALERALDVYGQGRGQWEALQRNGMRMQFGWKHRIGEYVQLYRKLRPDLG